MNIPKLWARFGWRQRLCAALLSAATASLSLQFVAVTPGVADAADSATVGKSKSGMGPRAIPEIAQYLRVNDAVPEFGGAYIDGDTTHLWLTNPTEEAGRSASAALVKFVSKDFDRAATSLQQARFTYSQLEVWNEQLLDVRQAVETLVHIGVSQRHNRIWIGATGAAAQRDDLMEYLDDRGIPRDAVLLTESSPVRMASSLLDEHRPVLGGLQIDFQTGFGGFFTDTCTLGMVGVNLSVSGFITNSHCSRTPGVADDGRYWQPTRPVFDTGWIGHETIDPAYFSGSPCPPGRVCRYSDANFVTLDNAGRDQGRIAKANLNSTVWPGAKYRITKKDGNVTPGLFIAKVGRTTGRTQGRVLETCQRFDVIGTNITLLCQNSTDLRSAGGDSGSPIFNVTELPEFNDVTLRGILWGGAEDGSFSVFSSIFRVQTEIGTTKLCGPAFNC